MEKLVEVTIFYYSHIDIDLNVYHGKFTCLNDGRILIPEEFKDGKDIIAVCNGHIEVLEQE